MTGREQQEPPGLRLDLQPKARVDSKRLFFIFILKKQNFKNICRIGKFSKMCACRGRGDCRPSSWRHDLNVKKNLHLGPGAQGALNSEIVKSI